MLLKINITWSTALVNLKLMLILSYNHLVKIDTVNWPLQWDKIIIAKWESIVEEIYCTAKYKARGKNSLHITAGFLNSSESL